MYAVLSHRVGMFSRTRQCTDTIVSAELCHATASPTPLTMRTDAMSNLLIDFRDLQTIYIE